MEYKVIRSRRTTVAVTISMYGEVTVRAPIGISDGEISRYVDKYRTKIESIINQRASHAMTRPSYSSEEIKQYIAAAENKLAPRIASISSAMGCSYSKMKISKATSYWGCCTGRGVILLNWRLLLASDRLIDYVIVHELVHIGCKGHGKRFWQEVARHCPDMRECRRELNELAKAIF